MKTLRGLIIGALVMLALTGAVAVANSDPPAVGDVTCSGTINTLDALAIQQWIAGQSPTQGPGCLPIGCAQVYPDLVMCYLPE